MTVVPATTATEKPSTIQAAATIRSSAPQHEVGKDAAAEAAQDRNPAPG